MLVGYLGLGSIGELGFPPALLLGLFVLSLIFPLNLRIWGIGDVQLLNLLSLLFHRRLDKVDSHIRHGFHSRRTWVCIVRIIPRGWDIAWLCHI